MTKQSLLLLAILCLLCCGASVAQHGAAAVPDILAFKQFPNLPEVFPINDQFQQLNSPLSIISPGKLTPQKPGNRSTDLKNRPSAASAKTPSGYSVESNSGAPENAHHGPGLDDTIPSSYIINIRSILKTFREIAKFYLPIQQDRKQSTDDDTLPKTAADPSSSEGGTDSFSPSKTSNDSILSPECERDVQLIFDVFEPVKAGQQLSALTSALWPLRLMDSWGKSRDGIMVGDSSPIGFMKECLDVVALEGVVSGDQLFRGQYCLVGTISNASVSKIEIIPKHYGTCIPSSCTAEEMRTSLDLQLKPMGFFVSSVACQQADEPPQFGTWEIVGCVAIGVMVLPVLLATLADLCHLSDKVPPVLKAFSAVDNLAKIFAVKINVPGEISCIHAIRVLSICWVMLGHQYNFIVYYGYNIVEYPAMTQSWVFQIIYSGYKSVDTFFTIGGLLLAKSLFTNDFCTEKKPKRSQITKHPQEDLINGHKSSVSNGYNNEQSNEQSNGQSNALSNALSNEHSKGGHCNPLTNELERETSLSNNIDAIASVENGIKVIYTETNVIRDTEEQSAFRTIQEQGALKTIMIFRSNYIMYVFHRIVRLVPSIFLVIMFYAGPAVMFMSGPSLPVYKATTLQSCRNNWWIDLVMLSNVMMASNKPGCLGQCWYVAVDFQIYLAAPFFFLPMKLFGKKYLYLLVLVLISCLIPGIIVMVDGLLPAMLVTANFSATNAFMHEIYLMPYTRASPYFVGAIFALMMIDATQTDHNGESRMMNFLTNKVVRVVGWSVFCATCLVAVFGLAGENSVKIGVTNQLNDVEDFFYASFDIAAWAACIGWMVSQCALGLGGPLNTFLSHPMWQPLSRVSFSVYLISVPVQFMIFFSFERKIYLTHTMILLTYCGVVVLSFASAFFISLVAEAPFIALLKLLSNKRGLQLKNK